MEAATHSRRRARGVGLEVSGSGRRARGVELGASGSRCRARGVGPGVSGPNPGSVRDMIQEARRGHPHANSSARSRMDSWLCRALRGEQERLPPHRLRQGPPRAYVRVPPFKVRIAEPAGKRGLSQFGLQGARSLTGSATGVTIHESDYRLAPRSQSSGLG